MYSTRIRNGEKFGCNDAVWIFTKNRLLAKPSCGSTPSFLYTLALHYGSRDSNIQPIIDRILIVRNSNIVQIITSNFLYFQTPQI